MRREAGRWLWALLLTGGADAVIHPEGAAAIGAGGEVVVYAGNDGPHAVDLYQTRRGADGWSPPALLTAGSPHACNNFPALSADGARVVWVHIPIYRGGSGLDLDLDLD